MNFFEPKSLSDVVGNKSAINTLRAILNKKEMAPKMYIFEGVSGVGKTAISRFFLKELTGVAPKKFNTHSYLEIPSWGNMGDAPIVFEDANRIPKDSWDTICNAFDKGKHPIFAFTVTDYFKLPQQVKTRALRVQLSRLSSEECVGFLSRICAEHSITYELSALTIIAKLTKGVPKEMIKTLQLVSMSGDVTVDMVNELAPIDLEIGCNAILSRLIPDFNGALTALDKLDLVYSTEEIINTLFTAYSNAVFNKNSSPIYEGICSNLSNYRKMTEIFIKWKRGLTLPSDSLPLLLKELSECDEDYAPKINSQSSGEAKKSVSEWEVGVAEFAKLCNAEIVE